MIKPMPIEKAQEKANKCRHLDRFCPLCGANDAIEVCCAFCWKYPCSESMLCAELIEEVEDE